MIRPTLHLSCALALALCLCAPAYGQEASRTRLEALLARVDERTPERWPALADELVALGPDAIGPCLERLAAVCAGESDAASPAQSQVLFEALLRLPRPALREHFEYVARHPSGSCERLLGLQLLARLGQAEDVALATRLAAPGSPSAPLEPALRAAYALALSGLVEREPPHEPSFAQAYAEVHGALKATLVRSLGGVRSEASLGALARLLGRDEAADALLLIEIGRHGRRVSLPADEDVLARVRGALDSAREDVAVEAALALGELADSGAAARLAELAVDARPAPAQAARQALARLSGAEHGPDGEAWRAWHEAQAQWWRERAPALLAALEHGEAREVALALRELALHPLYRDGIAPHLEAALARPEPELAALACAVAGRLGSRLAVPALELASESSDPRAARAARAALARLRAPVAGHARRAGSTP